MGKASDAVLQRGILHFETYKSSSESDHDYIGILVHGAGGTIWDQDSKPYLWMRSLNLCHSIYSIELPSHGHNVTSGLRGSTADHVAQFSSTLSRIPIDNAPIILMAYSLGAAFVLKLHDSISERVSKNPESVMIIIGCTPQSRESVLLPKTMAQQRIWQKFWTPQITKSLLNGTIANNFRKLHGDEWTKMAESVRGWFGLNSALLCTEEEIRRILDSSKVKS